MDFVTHSMKAVSEMSDTRYVRTSDVETLESHVVAVDVPITIA